MATSTRRLFQALVAEQPSRYRIEALVPGVSGLADQSPEAVHRSSARRIVGWRRALWQQAVLPGLLRRLQADVLVATCYTAPRFCDVPYLLIVHDLIAWLRPDLCPLGSFVHARLLLRSSVRRARLVLVPSAAVGAALQQQVGVDDARLRTLPWGVDRDITPMSRAAAASLLCNRFAINGPFVLFVGCMERKKDLLPLVRACDRLGVPLVLAGPGSPAAAKEVIGPSRTARYVGFVPTATLSALYSAAAAVVMPSIIEGFGLPVVEAMHCGAPVIVSDIPALREVCAGAAVHFQQGHEDALVDQLALVLHDPRRREQLVSAGRARAAQLGWAPIARQFVALLDEVTGARPAGAYRPPTGLASAPAAAASTGAPVSFQGRDVAGMQRTARQ